MRTPAKNPKAKKAILDAAQELMLSKGFAATSVDEICKKAKLTKGTFFHYFKSKEDLGKTALERFCCSSRDTMQACGCGEKNSDPLKRVYGYVDFARGAAKKPAYLAGCLLGTFTQELSDTHPRLRAACADGFDAWAGILKKDLKEAKAKYAPKADFDCNELAEYFISVFEGSLLLAKARKDNRIIEKNLTLFKGYLKTLFKKG